MALSNAKVSKVLHVSNITHNISRVGGLWAAFTV